jgi:hypothetical protein
MDELQQELQVMAVSNRRAEREIQRLTKQLQLQEDEYVVLVESGYMSPLSKQPEPEPEPEPELQVEVKSEQPEAFADEGH